MNYKKVKMEFKGRTDYRSVRFNNAVNWIDQRNVLFKDVVN